MKRKTMVVILGLLVSGGAAGPRAEAAPTCIRGVSKKVCDGRLTGGTWNSLSCAPASKCTAWDGKNLQFRAPLASSANSCEETGALAGELMAKVGLRLRVHSPLPDRGSWTGSFTLENPSASSPVAQGKLFATLGVGTHRQGECGQGCGKECETCYDAGFDPVQQIWTLSAEGFLDGSVLSGPYQGCAIRWSFQGKFTARGDATGPALPNQFAWGFCGTIDGVLECPCG